MKKTFYFVLFSLILSNYVCSAQIPITLNSGVDTINNQYNKAVIHQVIKYITARLNQEDGRHFWLTKESVALKNYDLYDAHSLYQIGYDNIIILGITQPLKDLFKVKVLFGYTGTDKVKTIESINDYYLIKQSDGYKLTNALYNNMRLNNYITIVSPRILYHVPPNYHFNQIRIDSANNYLQAIERVFNKTIAGKIDYVIAPTCERLYEILGESYSAGAMSSSTTFCGYFDTYNRLLITSGNEFYKHELLRTLNILYPNAPDLIQSGITCLWGGTRNKPVIYHLKKMYLHLLAHPEVFDKFDDFYFLDDETNPQFIFEAIVINYILKQEGKAVLLKLMTTLKTNITIPDFLKDHYQITDLRSFFLNEFKYYNTRKRLEFDDINSVK